MHSNVTLLLTGFIFVFSLVQAIIYIIPLTVEKSYEGEIFVNKLFRHGTGFLSIIIMILSLLLLISQLD